MKKVTLFTRQNCHLCETAHEIIERVGLRIPFTLEIIDVDDPDHEHWLDQYDHHVPVIHVDGTEIARHRLNEEKLIAAL